jgi:hypothetical protein
MFRCAKYGGQFMAIEIDAFDNEDAIEKEADNLVSILNEEGTVILFNTRDELDEFSELIDEVIDIVD